jgi:hypothetical protein
MAQKVEIASVPQFASYGLALEIIVGIGIL